MTETEAPTTSIFETMPIWPLKRAAAYLGISRNRVMTMAKEGCPEGAPEIEFTQEMRKWYCIAASVKEFKVWLDQHPEFATKGGTRTRGPEGTRKYWIYCNAEQEGEIREMFPAVRFEIANKPKVKEATEAEE
jgi:hypothetical protein